ncbi:hypothetical protein D9M70_538540 [compost metagenome]
MQPIDLPGHPGADLDLITRLHRTDGADSGLDIATGYPHRLVTRVLVGGIPLGAQQRQGHQCGRSQCDASLACKHVPASIIRGWTSASGPLAGDCLPGQTVRGRHGDADSHRATNWTRQNSLFRQQSGPVRVPMSPLKEKRTQTRPVEGSTARFRCGTGPAPGADRMAYSSPAS